MTKKRKRATARSAAPDGDRQRYKKSLRTLQVELVKLQRHFIGCDDRILVLLEGRDASGKDGTIKRIVQHLSPRETRVVALGTPSDRERTGWYFQRFVPYLPLAREFVLFNRSWYNRAGVERVMGFCTDDEYEEFMQTVQGFEHMLIKSGITLLKYYLDISRAEQKKRLKARRTDPLKQWKVTPLDLAAQDKWDEYGRAEADMLAATSTAEAPWHLVDANDKRRAQLGILRTILGRADPDVVRVYGGT